MPVMYHCAPCDLRFRTFMGSLNPGGCAPMTRCLRCGGVAYKKSSSRRRPEAFDSFFPAFEELSIVGTPAHDMEDVEAP